MIISKREDIVYVVDELERSLHPKLTEHFLTLFMKAHVEERVQIIFTSHEDTINWSVSQFAFNPQIRVIKDHCFI